MTAGTMRAASSISASVVVRPRLSRSAPRASSVGIAHRRQDVADVGGAAGARGARRRRDPLEVEGHRDRAAVGAAGDDRRDVREPLDRVARGLHAVDGRQRGQETVAPGADLRDERRALRGPQLERRRHPDGARHVLGAGAPVALLRPAVLLGEDVGAAPDPQRPGALRALGLVRRQRDEVRAEGVDVEVEPRRRLDGIDVEQEPAPRPDDLRDLGDRLDRADLVVREHHRDEDRAVGDRPLDVLGVDAAVAVDRDLHDLEAELLEVLERVADRVVLDGRRHDAVSARPAGPGGALEREVVGLGPAAREHDLAGVRADRPREPLVGVVERLAGDAAERVRGRRVAERAAEERQHRLERLGAQGRGRGMIEIDRHCGRL